MRAASSTLRKRPEGGYSSIELAVVTPVIIMMLLVVVAFGRVTHARQIVDQAAAAAARTAGLAGNPAQANTAARTEAAATLAQAGISCAQFSVTIDTSRFRAGGTVSATLSCTANLSQLALAGVPGSTTLTATGRSPIEAHRDVGGP